MTADIGKTGSERINAIIAFMKNAEQLKNTLRSAHTSQKRPESSAEHSWSFCLLLLCFEDRMPDIDMLRLLKLAIIHDLGEAISGDVPAPQQTMHHDKSRAEREDFLSVCAPLPADLKSEMISLWDEYNAAQTPEAIMAKGLDKIETMLQHIFDGTEGNIDFAFNLNYGKENTDAHALLRSVRAIVDEKTRSKLS